MTTLIEELTKKFEDSIQDKELGEKLRIKFEKMINRIAKNFKEDQNEEVEEILKEVTEEWINLDLEEKQRRLYTDEKFGEIMRISYEVYDMAINVLLGNEINIDFKVQEKIDELETLLTDVKQYNKEEARRLVSESILDLKFLENPNTDILSLRIGSIKYNKK